jgi:hypothetical protein
MRDAPNLTARFEKLGSRLRIDYTVVNPGSGAVFLTNHACRMDAAGPVPDRKVAFVFVEGAVVHVTKRIPPPPRAFHNRLPHFVVPLAAGEEFAETLEVELPIQPVVPYRRVELTGERSEATQVRLSIGYKAASPLVEAVKAERAGKRVYLLRSTLEKGKRPPRGTVLPVEQFLVTEPHEMALPVLLGRPSGP